MNLREKTRAFMKTRGLSRAEMARRAGLRVSLFCKWLDRRHHGTRPRQTEAVLVAYFKRTELVERQRQKKFLRLQAPV